MSRALGTLCVALAAAALPAAASDYTAESTFRKLAGTYPGIAIASAEAPAPVRVLRDLTYVVRGKRELKLDLYLPGPVPSQTAGCARLEAASGPGLSCAQRPSPLVVLVHGGGWRSGERGNLAPLAARLAARGYAAATVSYRLSPEARYPAAIHDIKQAVRWLRAQAPAHGIDAQRIAIAGGSAGGQIAALAGATNDIARFDPEATAGAPSSAVQAVINIDGLSDFTSEAARLHEDDPAKNPSAAGAWLGGRYAEKTALWHDASPLTHAGPRTPPMLFIGSGQPRFSAGREEMVAKLQGHGIAAEVVILPGTPHSFWLFDPWLAPTVDATVRFLERALGQRRPVRPAWSSDLGNGRYRNPVLHADYSDPDVIRVGDRYYMTASSFANAPGLPLLTSQDMINWELVGHALPRLVPEAQFGAPQHGKGVWAPTLRHHAGKFWIFYPDPDNGVHVITADRFEGPWSAPHLLLPGKGIIDPAPLWDDDGTAWLLHAWAKSRAGFNNVLTLRGMAPDGRSLLDTEGKVIIDGNQLPGYRTLEGPKLYKSNGYYYVFAPAGGVEHGWQSVFRSRHIGGPYEARIVMAQGATRINGPHQGAWVRTPEGSDWFFHFQDKRAFGRVVHLQPMAWRDGWPLIGEPSAQPGVGQPVLEHAKPVAGAFAVRTPPDSDEFDGKRLGLQWQFVANLQPGSHSLDARAGHLRLYARPLPHGELPLRRLTSVLTQKLPAPVFSATGRIELHPRAQGDSAGLILYGESYAWLGLRRQGEGVALIYATCRPAQGCRELIMRAPREPLDLRVEVGAGGLASFSWSTDGERFIPAGPPFVAAMGRWVGAQMGLFSAGASGAFADVDYFRVTP